MKEIIRDITPFLNDIFKHLHENPEISWKEYETTNYLKSVFEDFNCRVELFDDSTGLIVEIGEGEPVVALRADIDALWQEIDDTFKANHSCGHDAHMTIAIGTFLTLYNSKLPEKGTFRLLFQPAEEKGTGALSFVDRGLVDDVDYLYGMHLRPEEELSDGYFSPAIRHGAARFIKGTIHGEDAHGARPHLNANAIQVGTELVQHINNINVNPMVPNSAKITSFHSGGKSTNIIPGNANFSIDVRAQTNSVMDKLTVKINHIANMLEKLHGIQINLRIEANIAAAVLNDEATECIREAILDTFGEGKLKPVIVTTGGDDFHFYTMRRPNIRASMLAIGCNLKPGLHHPNMSFNHEAIISAVKVLTQTILNTLNK